MITALELYEATAIELNKLQAPSLKLYEFNYYANKAVYLFVNKIYNIYDINQQTSDDLRVLKSTAVLSKFNKDGNSYKFYLPNDYLHILNCICTFSLKKKKNCLDDIVDIPATRLTADSWGLIILDIYNRPSPTKPYFYINNKNTNDYLPTHPINDKEGTEVVVLNEIDKDATIKNIDIYGLWYEKTGEIWEPVSSDNNTYLYLVSKYSEEMLEEFFQKGCSENPTLIVYKYSIPTAYTNSKSDNYRDANASTVVMEIRCGKDNTVFELQSVSIDYLKAPQRIRLTLNQLDSIEDKSLPLEFPDYVVQEIINELVHLIMERNSDPRLTTNYLITQSIARPTQQLETT